MTNVVLQKICKQYTSEHAAVHKLNLTVSDGELLVLLGPSGCGKTTILRLIAGLIQPTSGDLLFDGRSVVRVPPEKRGAVMVFQEYALFPFMNVFDNVAFGLKLKKVLAPNIRSRVAEALAAVQLSGFEGRWPDQLSGGQRQRVALARALVVEPKVLLLDEPLSNLDLSLRIELREMIRNLQKKLGITTIFVTHDQTEAVAIADRIALMINGCLRQVAPPRNFYDHPADEQVVSFFGGANILPGIKLGKVVQTALGPLELACSEAADGPVTLTIRPEAIEIGEQERNNFPAQIRLHHYYGQMAYWKCASGWCDTCCHHHLNGNQDVSALCHCGCDSNIREIEVQVAVSPFQDFGPGETVMLHLPPERICLVGPYAPMSGQVVQ
jgi:ABC-type Fe3+/spermidine/putrescine transport system ATPase subunit